MLTFGFNNSFLRLMEVSMNFWREKSVARAWLTVTLSELCINWVLAAFSVSLTSEGGLPRVISSFTSNRNYMFLISLIGVYIMLVMMYYLCIHFKGLF